MYKSVIIFTFLLFTSVISYSQQGVTTFGLQVKPIIPNRLIGTFEQEFNDDPFQSTVKQKMGFSAGMIVRIGLTERISLETGLNFTRRNFGLNYALADSGYAETGKVRIISYSLPLSALVYIRLSDSWFMNTSLGAALTVFPSDVQTRIGVGSNQWFQQEGAYKSKIQGAALANVGFEYRTEKSGYWYIGASYHLPFVPIMTFAMSFEYDTGNLLAIDNIRGSYLTLDFRYFFHEAKKTEKK